MHLLLFCSGSRCFSEFLSVRYVVVGLCKKTVIIVALVTDQ